MSLEQLISENTAALKRVADLLEVSNADRAKLLASAASGAVSSGGAGAADDGLSVADIKAAIPDADLDTLNAMLADEKAGKNRSSAVKAIEDAIAKAGKPSEPAAGPAASESTKEPQAASPSPAPAADKNSQPVPAAVTGEQASQAIGAWFGETDDETERASRRSFVEQIVAKLGARVSELEPAKARQAVFYLRRKRAGLDVDFDAAFDFDGSPTQEVAAAAAPAASADDELL